MWSIYDDREQDEIEGQWERYNRRKPMAWKKNHKATEQATVCPKCGRKTYVFVSRENCRACTHCGYTDQYEREADHA